LRRSEAAKLDPMHSVLALTTWGGTQITATRVVLAAVLELLLVAYLTWCAKFWGK